jgi:hypothetical protein
VERHVVGQDREAWDSRGGVSQPVVVLVRYHDPLNVLSGCGEMGSDPSHVPGNLPDYAVSGMPALEFHDD